MLKGMTGTFISILEESSCDKILRSILEIGKDVLAVQQFREQQYCLTAAEEEMMGCGLVQAYNRLFQNGPILGTIVS